MLRTGEGEGDLEIALVTGGAGAMPVPDRESHLPLEALALRGVRGALVPWTEERDWAAVRRACFPGRARARSVAEPPDPGAAASTATAGRGARRRGG